MSNRVCFCHLFEPGSLHSSGKGAPLSLQVQAGQLSCGTFASCFLGDRQTGHSVLVWPVFKVAFGGVSVAVVGQPDPGLAGNNEA